MRPWAENKPQIGEKSPPLDCFTEAELWREGDTVLEDTTNTALIPCFEFWTIQMLLIALVRGSAKGLK